MNAVQSDPDWDRAGQAVENRITELGMTYRGVAGRAPCDPSTLWKVRSGKADEVSEVLRNKIEVAIRWPEGTIERVATDPTYTAPTTVRTDPERVSALEATVEDLRRMVESLSHEVKQLLNGDGEA